MAQSPKSPDGASSIIDLIEERTREEKNVKISKILLDAKDTLNERKKETDSWIHIVRLCVEITEEISPKISAVLNSPVKSNSKQQICLELLADTIPYIPLTIDVLKGIIDEIVSIQTGTKEKPISVPVEEPEHVKKNPFKKLFK